MSKNNVRIAIRDSTDSHNVAFFDNKAGIKYKSANLHRFLAGSASILTIKYNSKDIDSIRSGCKLAFRYKNRDYWLNVMSFEKKGFEVELTAYSLGLELNNETRGEHKPANAMSIAEYVAYYDPEHALTIGVNEVSNKRIKLEWTGTDTILARLFSVANSFDAELDFNVELNDDYSLKRQVLNIYKKGNLGTNKASRPVRVGKELKVINYSDNIKELATSVRATGKDGLTIDGLNKKIYDSNKQLLYYSSGMTVYAPQSRDRFPSVGKGSNDNWIVKDLGETQYETKEALWGYMYGEIQKISVPEITYEVEGAIDAGIGDTQTLIDDKHFEPALYVQARVSELEDDILTGKVTNSTFINFERKYSQIADSLLKQVEALAEDAAPYIVRLSTDNGYNFKNGQGTSTITAKLEKYSKIVNAKWKWLINNSVVSETSSVKINASQIDGTLNVVAVAIVGGNEVATTEITLTNVNDGAKGEQGPKGDKGDDGAKGDKGETGNGIANTVITYGLSTSETTEPATWASNMPVLVKGMFLWTRTVQIYTNVKSTTSYQKGYIAKDGSDADTTVITEELDKAKQELTAVSNDLSKAKIDLQTQASQLQAQVGAQSELTKRVSTVEETANGTKMAVSELSKTVDGVTAWTKTVEDDLTSTKTTLSQVKTTADSTSQKTATLETGLNGVKADLITTTTTANTTKTNLANYQASNDKLVANLQSNLQTTNGNVSSLKTKIEAVPGQITSAVSAVEGKIPNVDNKNLLITSTATPNTRLVGSEVYPTPSASAENTATIKEAIKVSSGEKYTFTKKTSGKAYEWWRVSYLDSSFGLVSRFAKYEDEFTVTIPAGVSYMWISFPMGVKAKVEKGSNATGYTSSAEDIIASNTELKQTTNSIKASVKTVETTAQTALLTANTAQTGVNTLDKTTVKSASLILDNNGFVTKVGKTVNGNTFATMIAQNESDVQIIAKKMKVSGDMIVNGAITAEKLNVGNLSAVNSNLGKIEGGSLLLQENKAASSSIDSWGTFNRPAHKQGLYMDNRGLASSGAIQRKNGGETTPTDMPLAVLKSGELRFLVVDYNDNLENVLHYGLSDPDFGAIRFEIDSELKRRLTIMSSGYLNFTATNYTEWKSTGVAGCEYMIQGRLIVVNYDVTFNRAGTHTIGGIPQEFTKKTIMMTAKAWLTLPERDRNIQLNSDGSMHILNAEANINYRGTLVFSY